MVKIKVLIIITTDFVSYGGLTTVMMNYYRAMSKEKLQIDFASTNNPSNDLKKELMKNESRYFNLGNRKHNPLRYMLNLVDVIRQGRYDVIHVNGNSSTMAIELLIARACGVHTRIAHVHTTRTKYPYLNIVLHPIFKKSYTKSLATSRNSGKWLYGEKYLVLNNAIDTNKYKFDKDIRKKMRSKYRINEKFVIGNVGKFNFPKNHSYLLKIFSEYSKRDDSAILVIAGGGELEQQLKKKAKELAIKDKVIFLGMLDDVSEILQAFDVFIFPSNFEGLGLAVIEAQSAGLICIASKNVPEETHVTSNISYLDLNADISIWVNKISEAKVTIERTNRSDMSKIARHSIIENGYDISYSAKKLEQIYIEQ